MLEGKNVCGNYLARFSIGLNGILFALNKELSL